jgi:hypothetical protein
MRLGLRLSLPAFTDNDNQFLIQVPTEASEPLNKADTVAGEMNADYEAS